MTVVALEGCLEPYPVEATKQAVVDLVLEHEMGADASEQFAEGIGWAFG